MIPAFAMLQYEQLIDEYISGNLQKTKKDKESKKDKQGKESKKDKKNKKDKENKKNKKEDIQVLPINTAKDNSMIYCPYDFFVLKQNGSKKISFSGKSYIMPVYNCPYCSLKFCRIDMLKYLEFIKMQNKDGTVSKYINVVPGKIQDERKRNYLKEPHENKAERCIVKYSQVPIMCQECGMTLEQELIKFTNQKHKVQTYGVKVCLSCCVTYLEYRTYQANKTQWYPINENELEEMDKKAVTDFMRKQEDSLRKKENILKHHYRKKERK